MPSRIVVDAVRGRIQWTHDKLVDLAADLPDSLTQKSFPNASTPPPLWHLWHVARWADRHQAGLNDRQGHLDRSGVVATERWAREDQAVKMGLDPARLAVFEAGSAMPSVEAARIGVVDRAALLAYSRAVFADFDAATSQLSDDDLTLCIRSTANVSFKAGVPDSLAIVPVTESRILDELLFHEGHAARHLGMMEALRGLLMGYGSATV